MPNHASWLHTRAHWFHVRYDNESTGKAAIFPHERSRLPLDPDLNRLLVVIADRELSVYKLDKVPTFPLLYDKPLLRMTIPNLTQIQEFWPWPHAEAIHASFTGTDCSESLPKPWLYRELINEFNLHPISKGWIPVNRGSLGLSYVRDLVDGERCVEVQATRILLYKGPFHDNEALYDHRVTRIFGIHEIPKARVLMQDNDFIEIRLLMRRMRIAIWDLVVLQDLPF
jgi:hypothetical protein